MEVVEEDKMGEARGNGHLDRTEGRWCGRSRRNNDAEGRLGKKSKECDHRIKDDASGLFVPVVADNYSAYEVPWS